MVYINTFLLGLLILLNVVKSLGQTDVIRPQELHCMTEDGISLAGDLYLPIGEEDSFPVVLLRTPYGKQQYAFLGNYFAKNGYATLVQDVRGKFRSNGEFFPFIHERKDGLATLDWIQKQSWCNGQLGIYGVSYPAFCGLTLADENHPILKTIVNVSGWINPSDMANPGGPLHLMLNLTWLLHEETQQTRNLGDYNTDSLLNYLPVKDALRSIGVRSKAWEDTELLSSLNQDFKYRKVDIPVLHVAGAYDFVKRGTLNTYWKLLESNKARQKLIFGPWFHNQYLTTLTEVGEIDFEEASEMGSDVLLEKAKNWFDQWLKPQAKTVYENSAEVFIMFKNQWQQYKEFPPQGNCDQFFYLSSTSGANSLSGDGRLTPSICKQMVVDTFTFDPYHPVPTNGGANFHFFPQQLGIKDQSEIEARNDILVYKSAIFQEDISVIGKVKLEVYAATDGEDTDFTGKLVLVDPDGFAMNIVDGIQRGRHLNASPNPTLLQAGKIYLFEIDLGATAFQIPKGHHLRVEISSSNFPKFERNSNTAEAPFTAKRLRKAKQKVYLGGNYPSRLVLSILCN